MSLRNMRTATASTTRMDSATGTTGTHLENVKITPVMLSSTRGQQQIRQAIGLDGGALQVFETYTEPHTHTDDSVSVNQLPDIDAGDRLIVDGTTYTVRWAEKQPATSGFAATLILYITEAKRR